MGLLRSVCALSQRLTMCQNYFRFHFSRYIYDELYEKNARACDSLACHAVTRKNYWFERETDMQDVKQERNFFMMKIDESARIELYYDQ